MKIRDPRIVGQSGEADKMALQQIQAEEMMRSNPLYPAIMQLTEQVKMLSVQHRSENIRTQALMDYLTHIGILLHQEISDDGLPEGIPFSPQESKLFESLLEAGIIEEMPAYGFSAFYVEHNERIMFLVQLMGKVQQGEIDMETVIEGIREFNADPKRIIPITGQEFGLDRWLSANPAKLADEVCDALAEEFGLVKEDEDEAKASKVADSVDASDAQGGQDKEADVLPFDRGASGSTDDEAETS